MSDIFTVGNPSSYLGSPSRQLRADRGLTYIGFVQLLEFLWTQHIGYRSDGMTPRVPFRASYTGLDDPDYPCVVYALELRKPYLTEPKPRTREVFSDDNLVVRGQRFENIIKFTAIDRILPAGTEATEEIIEHFEDFMMEYTPVLKRMGVSDLFYARRLPDTEVPHPGGINTAHKTLAYQVVLEKVTTLDVWKLEQIEISARLFLSGNQPHATPSNATPNITATIDDQYGNDPVGDFGG